jgi:hypothetical protein
MRKLAGKYLHRVLAVLLLCPALLVSESRAQGGGNYWKRYRWEVSFGVGPSNFLGELGGSNSVGSYYFKDINFLATRYAASLGIRYKLSQYIAVRTHTSFGRLYGNDKLSEEFFRNNRNLNFRTNIFEVNGTVEASLYKESLGHRYRLRGPVGRKAFQMYTYVFTGAGLFYFNPQGQYKSRWYDLRPMSTEGQGILPTRNVYANWQFTIPIGIGFKYTIDQNWGVGIEYGFRTTFTDYIDDVSQTYVDYDLLADAKGPLSVLLSDQSTGERPEITAPGQQRGNPNNTDAYMFTMLSVHYRMKFNSKYRFKSRYYKDISPLF